MTNSVVGMTITVNCIYSTAKIVINKKKKSNIFNLRTQAAIICNAT